MATTSGSHNHRVVVIGSGFGGLFSTQALKKAPVEVTMIARTSHHLFQPLLYQVATGILSEGEIAPSTREILARQKNARVLLGDVTQINLADREVIFETVGQKTTVEYDSLIVAAGAGQSYFGNDHFSEFAPGMKTIDDALELRGRIFGAFELAELARTPEEAERLMTFVVVGAGATGVEMAGQIAELAHRTLKGDFRSIDPANARIVLVDGAPLVLPAFGDHLGGRAQAKLESMGVEMMLNTKVIDLDATGLVIEAADGKQQRIESVCKVWAAGVKASSLSGQLAEQTGAALDRAGRISVEPDCTLPGHPEVFVIGDMMSLNNLPGVSPVAIQQAAYVAGQIKRRIAGEVAAGPFEYFDKGSMATISRFSAVASIRGIRFAGFLAWLLWLAVHLVYIIGFKHRVTTLLHWAISFIGRGRPERATTQQQIFARTAMKRLGEQAIPPLMAKEDESRA